MKNKTNIVHNQNTIYSYCLSKKKYTPNFQIIIGNKKNLNKISFIFFNRLFNEIEVAQLESFLNYHFDNYKFNKKDFLRTLKLDITEMFRTLIKPVKIIDGSEPGIMVDVMPFFHSYCYEEYLGYERRFKECEYWIEDKENELAKLGDNTLIIEKKDIQNPEPPAKKHVLSIPTNATPEKILDFWLRLLGNNEKGEPYWNNKQEIEHFVNQNFEGFPGVDELKEFIPSMTKSELNQVTWTFFKTYGKSKTKKQYEKLLLQNFTKFKDDKNVYCNIKYQNNEHLRKLYFEFPLR
ncbi:MAG: hypothetical protein A2X03_12515 [Bacteroidetes bacterium GWA2_40_15]|nr:MAG: hypothetical protein A2X03_12515 [Bacteroidetes bacterium GWA2_40_15]